jgi:hypothetical protein
MQENNRGTIAKCPVKDFGIAARDPLGGGTFHAGD